MTAEHPEPPSAPRAQPRPKRPPGRSLIPDEPREGYIALGRILRAHGLNGETRIMSFNPGAPNLPVGARLMAGDRELVIQAIRPANNAWIVSFEGVAGRDDAEALGGLLLEAPESTVKAEEGAYFVHELVGLRVSTADGRELGEITEVLQPGANDVYVVRGPSGEVLIPAIGDVITEIDVPGGRMIITPLPGLLDESL